MDTPNPITEEWLRKKANIDINNLEDVKSLILPGTYQVKIHSLGDALRRFTRLKELDLSKNQLHSLDGLENLKFLERLNLYYNNIGSISEIERLRANKNLVEVDLRLNPITKEDIDYRLYLINILPNIEKIDDRDVKESEREMALIYFEQKTLDTRRVGFELFQESNKNQVVSNRVKTVSNLVKRSVGISNEEYHQVPVQASTKATTASSASPNYEQYSAKDLKEIGEKENRQYERRNSINANRFKSASLQDLTTLDVHVDWRLDKLEPCVDKNKNAQFSDETEAYSNFKTRASFTPNPLYDQVDEYMKIDEDKIDLKNGPLFNLLDLVDKYWNGTKSLHKNFKFLGLANQALSESAQKSHESCQIAGLQAQVEGLKDENSRLNQTIRDLRSNKEQGLHEIEKKNRQLMDENDHLKKKLIITQEENKKISREMNEKSNKFHQNCALETIETGNENLKRDVEVMRIKLKQYEQLQSLTSMLQESHRSLVTTNEHLLKEINDQKPHFRDSQSNKNLSQQVPHYNNFLTSPFELPQTTKKLMDPSLVKFGY